jgi:hypothetical protein
MKPAKESDYAPLNYDFNFASLIDTAKELDASPQRVSRLLRILQIPVHRIGNTILLDNSAVHQVRDAIENGTVRRGRKKKSETA